MPLDAEHEAISMYHFIVKQKLRRAFRDINAGRYDRIVPQFAAEHRHTMYGNHALAGERTTIATTAQWYARLQRLMPDLSFDVRAVAVDGWPWRTVATVAWNDHFTLPDGSPGSNQGVHVFGLAWGRVISLAVHCDTAKFEDYCQRMAAMGREEAIAAPITDR
jgi:ketosteroid isomerase-like protein